MKQITGPIGRFMISLIVCKFRAAPKLMYKIETKIMTEYTKSRSMRRWGRRMVTLSDSVEFSVTLSFLFIVTNTRVWPVGVNAL